MLGGTGTVRVDDVPEKTISKEWSKGWRDAPKRPGKQQKWKRAREPTMDDQHQGHIDLWSGGELCDALIP